MAGVTDRPFRMIARELGADMVYTEMISAKALTYNNIRTQDMLIFSKLEQPIRVQVFGHEPEVLAEAVKYIAELGFCGVDLNLGCPAPKVVRNGDGSALLQQPELVGRITEAMVKASHLPVTAKIRAGFKHINAVEISHILQESGAVGVTIHARTRDQYYSGHADWDIIHQVKKAVKIEVIANGDIDSPIKARLVLKNTNADGIMIGRAALGNPWIFNQIKYFLETGDYLHLPSVQERLLTALKHCKLAIAIKGAAAIYEMRKHVSWYTTGIFGASDARAKINKAATYTEIEEILTKLGSRAGDREESPSSIGQDAG
jgi:nifR3 family TIM-barrel protein